MNRIQLFLLLLISGLVLLAPNFLAKDKPVSLEFRKDELSIKTADKLLHYTVEVAENNRQQRYGLMQRTQLAGDQGMLFILRKPRVMSMWMKNTPLSLDMLFIDSAGKILYIYRDATPFSESVISYEQPVGAILELLGGTTAANNINVGDQVLHPHFKP
jgi:uncharacterized protein